MGSISSETEEDLQSSPSLTAQLRGHSGSWGAAVTQDINQNADWLSDLKWHSLFVQCFSDSMLSMQDFWEAEKIVVY